MSGAPTRPVLSAAQIDALRARGEERTAAGEREGASTSTLCPRLENSPASSATVSLTGFD